MEKVLLDSLSKVYTDNLQKIAEMQKDWEDLQAKEKPIWDQIAVINQAQKDLGCGKFDLAHTTGEIGQKCNLYDAEVMQLSAQISSLTSQYAASHGFSVAPSTKFQDTVSGAGTHYTFYYDAQLGHGDIYNQANPLDHRRVYCSSGVCNIYGP
ncbi:MAG: hypothetical protein AAB909_00010 [Patescibacteria group bacterium]